MKRILFLLTAVALLCGSSGCATMERWQEEARQRAELERQRFQKLQTEANQGDNVAQYWLADYYLKKGDVHMAMAWFRRSASQGNVEAESALTRIKEAIEKQAIEEAQIRASKLREEEAKRAEQRRRFAPPQKMQIVPWWHLP